MKKKQLIIRLIVAAVVAWPGFLSAQLTFNNIDSLLAFARRNSSVARISTQQSLLSKWTKVAALGNTINFKNPLTFSATDNLQLPVNFIPAEAFGGPAGTFRQITLGQQYVTNFNFSPQIDIINPSNWAKVKSAEVNKELTEVNNQVVKKALFESIAAAYYNAVAFNEQIAITEKSLASSDSVLLIVRNKFGQGIVRQQDVNNAEVNVLLVKDRLQQLKTNRDLQLNSVKILCDIPPGNSVTLNAGAAAEAPSAPKATSHLQGRYYLLQSQYARSELRASRMSMLPVLSIVYYQGWQKNSNSSFFDGDAAWIQSKYIGLRLTMPFPPDVNRLSQNYTSKISSRIAAVNAAHAELQNEFGNQSLQLDFDKAAASLTIAMQIADLKQSNYEKSLDQYSEGILSTDLLLTAFTDLLNSRLNQAAAHAALENAKLKIKLNNTFQ